MNFSDLYLHKKGYTFAAVGSTTSANLISPDLKLQYANDYSSQIDSGNSYTSGPFLDKQYVDKFFYSTIGGASVADKGQFTSLTILNSYWLTIGRPNGPKIVDFKLKISCDCPPSGSASNPVKIRILPPSTLVGMDSVLGIIQREKPVSTETSIYQIVSPPGIQNMEIMDSVLEGFDISFNFYNAGWSAIGFFDPLIFHISGMALINPNL
jgi:hypothetical protein